MPRINELLPQEKEELKSIYNRTRLESLLTTDTFKIGDKAYIRDAEAKEIWEIHKFISHLSQKPAAILVQKDDHDASYLPVSTITALLEQLILI
ncbi:TPA: hypothetical protein JGR43_002023 [Legionella pneumophila]|nr:hypothetical protein [Legionella pneumophila]